MQGKDDMDNKHTKSEHTKNNKCTLGIKLLSGKSLTVTVNKNDTVGYLKKLIFDREGIPPQRQNLLVMGVLLAPDSRSLADYNLKGNDLVYVTAGGRIPFQDYSKYATIKTDYNEKVKSRPVHIFNHKEVSAALQTRLVNMKCEDGGKLLFKMSKTVPDLKEYATQSASSTFTAATNSAASSSSGATTTNDAIDATNLVKLRAEAIHKLGPIDCIIRADTTAETETTETEIKMTITGSHTMRWPRSSEMYAMYTRKTEDGLLVQGLTTVGLSNPFRTTHNFLVGIGLEIQLECPIEHSCLLPPTVKSTDNKTDKTTDKIFPTKESLSFSWQFGIVYEIAQQCFVLGLQIRSLIETMGCISVELAGQNLPNKYLDPETGRCCVLLSPSIDQKVARGFNVDTPYKNGIKTQSVMFVTARLLTFEQCLLIRKDGADARKKLMDEFVRDKTFSISFVPPTKSLESSAPAKNGN